MAGTDSPDGAEAAFGGVADVLVTAAKVPVVVDFDRPARAGRGTVMTGRSGFPASLCRRDRRKREILVAYSAHGLTISSAIDLPGLDEVEPSSVGDADLVVQGAPFEPSDGTVDGTPVAVDETPGRRLTIRRRPGGEWSARGEGIGMCLDADASTMHVSSAASDESGALGWLVGGLGLALALTKRGELVMHGSHVVVRGRGVLMMAPSGHGKSVSAAAACASGARLIAEDTVTIDAPSGEADEFRVRSGSTVLRTRRTLDEMGEWFPDGDVSSSSDGRTLVRPDSRAAGGEGASLDRLVFLKLHPVAAEPRVDEVDPMSALTNCMTHLRIPGIVDPQESARAFERVAAMVDAVPAVVFTLPWNGRLDGFADDVSRCLEAC